MDMKPDVYVQVEAARGCGYRKSGPDGVGLYLVGDGVAVGCGRLPFVLQTCPTCGEGIKQSRGFTWIQPNKLFAPVVPVGADWGCGEDHCYVCPMNPRRLPELAGLLWVGAAHYTPEAFLHEARERGVSKRIASIPRDFKFGEHYVYLAHPDAFVNPPSNFGDEPVYMPGVFYAYKPSRVDLVIDDENEVPEKALNLWQQHGDNVRIVKVVKDRKQPKLI